MLIGLELGGDFGAAGDWTLEIIRAATSRAEAAAISFIMIPDAIAGLNGKAAWPDATILLGWLAASTTRIGLIAATATGGHQPYNLSRRLASLDQISGGRIGWCVTIADPADEAGAFSGSIRLPAGNTPERIAEFTQVVEGLWHSWDADALVLDKERGQFLDPAAMHTLDHNGPFFAVRGPLNVMRSQQDKPLLILHEAEVEALGPAAALADVILFGDQPPTASNATCLRRVDAAALANTIERADDNGDGLVVRVNTPAEADAVLEALAARLHPHPAHATTLRARIEGDRR